MGGVGSGNFSWRREQRNLVEHALVLDLAAINGARRFTPGTAASGRLIIVAPVGGRTMALTYDADLTDPVQARVQLSYCIDGVDRRQTVHLRLTRPRLGGVRIWFVCPVTSCRARVLYLPEGKNQFASRVAHGLTYRSQGESELFRSITQAQNIRARLGGDLSIHAPFPARPRGMHRRTYHRAEGSEIEAIARQGLVRKGWV
jgi:hypothetical protein